MAGCKQVNIRFQSSQEQLVNVSKKNPISACLRTVQFHHSQHIPSKCCVDQYAVSVCNFARIQNGLHCLLFPSLHCMYEQLQPKQWAQGNYWMWPSQHRNFTCLCCFSFFFASSLGVCWNGSERHRVFGWLEEREADSGVWAVKRSFVWHTKKWVCVFIDISALQIKPLFWFWCYLWHGQT